jgi:hypothetical protein
VPGYSCRQKSSFPGRQTRYATLVFTTGPQTIAGIRRFAPTFRPSNRLFSDRVSPVKAASSGSWNTPVWGRARNAIILDLVSGAPSCGWRRRAACIGSDQSAAPCPPRRVEANATTAGSAIFLPLLDSTKAFAMGKPSKYTHIHGMSEGERELSCFRAVVTTSARVSSAL